MMMMAAEDQSRAAEGQRNCGNVGEFLYTACYCEENIYMLCKALGEQGVAAADLSDLFVVFISNDLQRKNCSSGSESVCIWDYHVICIQKAGAQEALVWDLDTTLSLPVPLSSYVKEAFKPEIELDELYLRLFRVVRASTFLRTFASDRRHMRTPEGGWLAPPPNYECIVAEDGEAYNLEEYNRMAQGNVQHASDEDLDKSMSDKYGVVLSEDGFVKAFAVNRSRAPLQILDINNHQLVING
ncbi:protein N-terminal glutamine amidohydrolase [Marchantia polymorpha subsp. ruderalis]|uniref:Protein N-terminal glutamine amidohydrolase n=2 Tax=Marchantia polymorpha TaxID=3197 RepID=A0AAF6BW87_MARPO|nr:hypothetical protein MARPO_0062s0037 [Marchantia polymorpha]BBN16271.1 hypothetical protein Mp_7g04890 [Marchantia polymorpha subsp. ruderalis]|eukprot:PTQ36611.1 hypothetical protein MARPO_0062s0037 [Marchantia polymorpha]